MKIATIKSGQLLPVSNTPSDAATAHRAASFKRFYEAVKAGGMPFLPHLGWTTLYRVDREPPARQAH